jgi:hypothetical protein
MATPEIIFPILIMVAPILGLAALLSIVIFDSRTRTSRRPAALGSAGGASAYGSPMDTYSSASMAFDTGSVDCGPIDCGSVDCGTSGCD